MQRSCEDHASKLCTGRESRFLRPKNHRFSGFDNLYSHIFNSQSQNEPPSSDKQLLQRQVRWLCFTLDLEVGGPGSQTAHALLF